MGSPSPAHLPSQQRQLAPSGETGSSCRLGDVCGWQLCCQWTLWRRHARRGCWPLGRAAPSSPRAWAPSSMSPGLWPSGAEAQGTGSAVTAGRLVCLAVPVAAAALGADQPGEGVDRSTGVGVGIEAQPGGAADAAPLAGKPGAAEQIRPDRDAVEAGLVARRGGGG